MLINFASQELLLLIFFVEYTEIVSEAKFRPKQEGTGLCELLPAFICARAIGNL